MTSGVMSEYHKLIVTVPLFGAQKKQLHEHTGGYETRLRVCFANDTGKCERLRFHILFIDHLWLSSDRSRHTVPQIFMELIRIQTMDRSTSPQIHPTEWHVWCYIKYLHHCFLVCATFRTAVEKKKGSWASPDLCSTLHTWCSFPFFMICTFPLLKALLSD